MNGNGKSGVGNARSTLNDTWRWYQNISKVLSLRLRLVLEMNCRLQLVAEESQSWFHPEGGIDGQAGPLASWHHQNKQRALSWWLAKFQGGQWTAGEVVAVETPRRHDQTAKPPIPVEHCRPRQKGHTRRREKTTANVIPQLCFGCLVCLLSVHRPLSLPGLVDDCHFILSLLYKSACLVPSTRGPASTLPVC